MTITAYTSSFTPVCVGTNVSVSGVSTAATAYDWFSLVSGGSGALLTHYNTMATGGSPSATAIQNKTFVAHIANQAREALLPIVKSEMFYAKFVATQILVSSSITSILSTLTSIQNPSLSGSISALTPAYTSALASITASLNSLKSFEAANSAVGGSIDIPSTGTTSVTSVYATTTVLSSFTGVKTYLATLLDPVTLSGGTAIPTITSVNGSVGNAAALAATFTTASTALAALTAAANLQALNEMTAQNIFDTYCMSIQGYTSSGTTGNWASGSAPVGVIPAIDYKLQMTGTMQTGTASAGTPGAPTPSTTFW